jgi:hypothetical protein
MNSTRSVGMTLARRFNAGDQVATRPRRIATIESTLRLRYATRTLLNPFPALKGRAKVMPTLRVEYLLLKFPVSLYYSATV